MRLLEYAYSKERAGEVIGLLRERGIPTFSKFSGSPWIAPYQLAIFVCLDEQFDDAIAVLANPQHKVARPVDATEYEQLAQSADYSPVVKWGSILLVGLLVAFGAYVYFSGVPLLGA